MRKIDFALVVLLTYIYLPACFASLTPSITTLRSPVWISRNDITTVLSDNNQLKSDDVIITGDGGRIDFSIDIATQLRLGSNSKVEIRAESQAERDQSEAKLESGIVCITAINQSETRATFTLKIEDIAVVSIRGAYDICVLRQATMFAIKLNGGSAQVIHLLEDTMMAISEVGTELRMQDNGSYKLLYSSTDDWWKRNAQPATLFLPDIKIIANTSVKSSIDQIAVAPEAINSNIKMKITETAVIEDTPTKTELPRQTIDTNSQQAFPPLIENENLPSATYAGGKTVSSGSLDTQKSKLENAYVVYIFSTRSKSVAEDTNNTLKKAGYDTHIYPGKTGSVTRYRVGISGFKSLETANKFVNSIASSLGITDAWVAKQPK